MKNFLILIAIFFFSVCSYGQENIKKVVPVGDLYEVTIYYPNGNIMQHGFLNKEQKLHASWESYFQDGSRKCVASYDNGNKVGVWFYWKDGIKTMVTYKDNKIESVEEVDPIVDPAPKE
jgi:hypothetical protein